MPVHLVRRLLKICIQLQLEPEMETQHMIEPAAKKLKPEIPRILDGQYFQVLKQDGTKVEAICTTCNKIRKGDSKSTGNFIGHYNKDHPEKKDEVDLYRRSKNQDCSTSLKQTLIRPIVSLITTELVSSKCLINEFVV